MKHLGFLLAVLCFVIEAWAQNLDPCTFRPLTCRDQLNGNITTQFRRALVVVAHPDDAESAAGGTMAKLVAAGTQVRLVVFTSGDKGMLSL